MARQQPIELFMPPNMLKAKAGGGLGGLDMSAMKRADMALESLKSEFGAMIADDVNKLSAARTIYADMPSPANRAALMRAAHDLKGNAPTFEFPLIGRVAASLARLIGELPQTKPLPAALVDAHVNAVLVMLRQNMQATTDKTAQALCAELDARVDETLAPK